MLTLCELQAITLQLPQSDLISYSWRQDWRLNHRDKRMKTLYRPAKGQPVSIYYNQARNERTGLIYLFEQDRVSSGPQKVDNLDSEERVITHKQAEFDNIYAISVKHIHRSATTFYNHWQLKRAALVVLLQCIVLLGNLGYGPSKVPRSQSSRASVGRPRTSPTHGRHLLMLWLIGGTIATFGSTAPACCMNRHTGVASRKHCLVQCEQTKVLQQGEPLLQAVIAESLCEKCFW